jgi:hypothetical protein
MTERGFRADGAAGRAGLPERMNSDEYLKLAEVEERMGCFPSWRRQVR